MQLALLLNDIVMAGVVDGLNKMQRFHSEEWCFEKQTSSLVNFNF